MTDIIKLKTTFKFNKNDEQLILMYLQKIPKGLNNFKNLTLLKLDHCNMHNINNEIYNLYNLKELFLSNNLIKRINYKIINLKKLYSLLLDNNNLKYISKNIYHLKNIKILIFDCNPKLNNNIFNNNQGFLNLLWCDNLVIIKSLIKYNLNPKIFIEFSGGIKKRTIKKIKYIFLSILINRLKFKN